MIDAQQRDEIARDAMVAILRGTPHGQPWPGASQVAHLAYEYADAMIAESKL